MMMLVASSQSVDSQSTTDNQVCDGDVLSELKRDMKTLQDNQLVQSETIMSRLVSNNNQSTADDEVSDGGVLGELKRDVQILQNHLFTVMSRLGKISQTKFTSDFKLHTVAIVVSGRVI